MKRWVKPLVFLLCLVPLAWLLWRWTHNQLGFNRLEAVAHDTGDWTLRFLLLTLSITPLRRLPGLNGLIKFRRMFGLFAFFYGCLHFLHYLQLDKLWEWPEIYTDFTLRRFFIVGLIAWMLMVPLALTSFNAAIRWMGGKRWQMLHRLIYVSAVLGVVHYYWQGKSTVLNPLIYGLIVAILLASRVWISVNRSRSQGSPARAMPSSPVQPGSR